MGKPRVDADFAAVFRHCSLSVTVCQEPSHSAAQGAAQPLRARQAAVFGWANPSARAVSKIGYWASGFWWRAMDTAPRNLADLFARFERFLALLSAIQAFGAIAFQTRGHQVISLDLTGIIAFDAFREWEAVHRQRMRVRESGP